MVNAPMDIPPRPAELPASPKWQPIAAIDRRVAGVLVEKSKTTPAYYPMTLNAIVTAANQKSNRHPEMQLTADDVQESLERLRGLGAVGEVWGDGRVAKFRHYMYEWLGVEKAELSVMAELLLRGAQSVGDLRAHAARMEPLPDQNSLRPVLQSLIEKRLVLALSPEGRGQVVSHALYQPRELEKVKSELGMLHAASESASTPSPASARAPDVRESAPRPEPRPAAESVEVAQLRQDLATLRAELAQLRRDFDDLRAQLT